MNPTTSSIAQFTRRLALTSLFALGLAACGAAPPALGESEQPISAGDSEETGNAACAAGVTAADASADECQVTARGLCFANAEAACACAGCGQHECALAESFPVQAVCPSNGAGSGDPDAPVSSDPDAPVSSDGGGSSGSPGGGTEPGEPGGGSIGDPGCGAPGHTEPGNPGACSEGVPRSPNGGERCDFIVADACFDSAQSACACAGCDVEQCIVLESYPAQVRCL